MPGKGDRPAKGGGDRQRGGKGKSHKGDSGYRNYYNYDEGAEDEGGYDKGRRRQAKGGKKGGGGHHWKHAQQDYHHQDEEDDGHGKGALSTMEPGRSQLNSNAPDFKPSGYPMGALYGGGWGVGQTVQPPPPAMPPLWKEFQDEAGTPYYYNSKTGLSQWERPPELDPPKPPPPPAGGMGATEKSRDNGTGARGHRDGGRDDDSRRTEGGGLSAMLSGTDGGSGGGGCGGGREGRDRDGGGGGRTGTRGGKRRNNKPDDGKKEGSEFGPPGCNLFVFHLPDDWTDDDLHEYFAPHGNVVSAKVMKELGTGRSRGFGFVSYEDRVSAATAIKKMQGYKILGKRLKVEFKKGEQDNSRGEADDGGLDGASDDEGNSKKSYPDDERLIGYLRAISAKNVVKSLKESESGGGRPPDEADGQEDGAGGSGGGPGGPSLHETLFAPSASTGGGDDPASE